MRRGIKKIFVNSTAFVQKRKKLFLNTAVAEVNITLRVAFAETLFAEPINELSLSGDFIEKGIA